METVSVMMQTLTKRHDTTISATSPMSQLLSRGFVSSSSTSSLSTSSPSTTTTTNKVHFARKFTVSVSQHSTNAPQQQHSTKSALPEIDIQCHTSRAKRPSSICFSSELAEVTQD